MQNQIEHLPDDAALLLRAPDSQLAGIAAEATGDDGRDTEGAEFTQRAGDSGSGQGFEEVVVRFYVAGEAKGKARARSRIAKMGDGRQFVTHYTPKETVQYENRVAAAAHSVMQGLDLLHCPVAVSIHVTVMPPKSWSKKKTAKALAGQVMPTGKPDLDNIEKAILDGCNKVAYRDESQVCVCSKSKRYGATPGVLVEIRSLDAEAA